MGKIYLRCTSELVLLALKKRRVGKPARKGSSSRLRRILGSCIISSIFLRNQKEALLQIFQRKAKHERIRVVVTGLVEGQVELDRARAANKMCFPTINELFIVPQKMEESTIS